MPVMHASIPLAGLEVILGGAFTSVRHCRFPPFLSLLRLARAFLTHELSGFPYRARAHHNIMAPGITALAQETFAKVVPKVCVLSAQRD